MLNSLRVKVFFMWLWKCIQREREREREREQGSSTALLTGRRSASRSVGKKGASRFNTCHVK